MEISAQNKIPVWGTVIRALRDVFSNFDYAIKVSWLFFAISLFFQAIGVIEDEQFRELFPGSPINIGLPLIIAAILLQIFSLIFILPSMAVAWHRFILLGERVEGFFHFQIDRLSFKYLGYSVMLVIILFLPFLAGTALAAFFLVVQSLTFMVLAFLLMLILFLPMVVVSYRLSLKLPAVAVGNEGVQFKSALRITEGNSLRLLGMILATAFLSIALGAIIILLTFMISSLFLAGSDIGYVVVVSIMGAIVQWLSTIYGISFLTNLYRHFIGGHP